MKNPRRILIPTDLGYGAERALQHALFLAARTGAELHLIHAVTEPSYEDWGMVGFCQMEEVQARLNEDLVRHGILSVLGEDARDRIRVAVVADREAARAILAYERDHEIDLIVMGARAWKGFGGRSIESTAEKIVRLASASVLTIGETSRYRPGVIRRLLVPIDFSEHSAHALSVARLLAVERNAHLHVLHVLQPVLGPGRRPGSIGLDTSRNPSEARRDLRNLFRQTRGPDVPHRIAVVSGRPGQQIAAYAEREDIHLVVQGCRGLSGIDYLLLGSVAAEVVRRAPCPVLTVKPPPFSEDEAAQNPARRKKPVRASTPARRG